MIVYAIKFDNGNYWCGYNTSDKQLRKAVLYKSIKLAEQMAKDCMTRTKYIRPFDETIKSYKVVKVEIKEVEDE